MVSAGMTYPGQRIARRSKRRRLAYPDNINVAMNERLMSMAIGGGLVLAGLIRRSLAGLAAAAIGGGLIYRGATGYCPLYAALDIDTAVAKSAS